MSVETYPILLVDDDPISLEILAYQLTSRGHAVVAVSDGAQALRALDNTRIRIVISDWMMPGMDGLDLCRAVRARPRGEWIYFIMLTAHSDNDRLVEAFEAGVQDFLSKPVSESELVARLRGAARVLGLQDALAYRVQATQELNAKLVAQSRDMLALLDGLPGYAFLKDADGRYVTANSLFCEIAGRPLKEVVGAREADLFPAATANGHEADEQRILREGLPALDSEEELTVRGKPMSVLLRRVSVRDAAGRLERLIGFGFDVTALRNAQAAVRHLSHAVQHAPVSVVITDLEARITFVNNAFCRLTGYEQQEVLGRNPRVLKSGQTPPQTYHDMWDSLKHGREWRGELLNRRKNGDLFWELAIIAPLMDEQGRITHYVAVKEDITQRKAMECELQTAATLDKLTDLPNRAVLSQRLQSAIDRRHQQPQSNYAVLFLDFDRFKLVNDSLGHEAGDQMLREIAQRLQRTVRATDSVSRDADRTTAARLGGDEFVILLDGLANTDAARHVAESLLQALSAPYRLDGYDVVCTASIGIVTSDIPARNAADVLRDADTAMYEAKLAGRGRYVVFDISMRQRVQGRLILESDLRKALGAGQLFLMYQPILSLQSGEVESYEALLRWRHPERGLIPPSEFMPVAEDTGLVLPIGDWVLREACAQFSRWQRSMRRRAPRSINVNLSRRQLLVTEFPETVGRVMDQTGIAPDCLHLEITESAVMEDVETAARTLHALKRNGVKLDLDDFGIGYSSLACLHQFPLDVVKIDRSFIANINRGRDFAALVHAVAQLARNLNITVVAEGIETVEQLLTLQSMDCEFGQGYLFSKPLPADEVLTFRTAPGVLPGQAA